MKFYIVAHALLLILEKGYSEDDIPIHAVKPIHYNITLDPDFSMGLINGTVTISLVAQVNTTNFTIHAESVEINPENVAAVNSSGHNLKITSIKKGPKNNIYIISMENALMVRQQLNVTISNYSGTLRHRDNVGFCLNKYLDLNGKERQIAITQFKPRGARRTFPCLDEPHHKAKFQINIIRPSGYKTISNEPLQNTIYLGNGRFRDEFKESLNMSTFSLAFVIIDYNSSMNEERQRIFADVSMPNNDVKLRLREGVDLMSKLESFIGVKYPLSKIDSIALPNDLLLQAVKSWGILTYRSSSLIYTRNTLTNFEQQANVLEMSKGYTEQWFGNLISPLIWNYTWLNEGLSYYYMYTGAYLMDWDVMDHYVLNCVQNALTLDSSILANKLNYGNSVSNGKRRLGTYHKAGAIVRMIQHFLTMEVFQKGVRFYLQNNAFQGVSPPDLYKSFQRIVDVENLHHLLGEYTVNNIMGSWDSQAGYPVVNISRNYTSNNLTVTQTRFVLEGNDPMDDNIWYIPLSYTAEVYSDKQFSNTSADLWMSKKNIMISGVPSAGWIIFNKQQTGFYRVNYDPENWKRIINSLYERNVNEIHVLNRAQLLDDAFHLAHAGQLDFNTALDLSKYIQREVSFAPMAAFLNNIMVLYKKLSQENGHEQLRAYLGDLLNGEAIRCLTSEEHINGTHLDKLNRAQILNTLCIIGNEKCENYVCNKFRLWIQDPVKHIIPPNLESAILCGGIRFGSQKDWDLLYAKYKTTKNVLRKKLFLTALSCVTNNNTVKVFLKKILHVTSDMDPKDRLEAFKSLYLNAVDISFTLNYVVSNFDDVINSFSDALPEILITLAEKLTTKQHLAQIETLKYKFPWMSNAFEQPIQIVIGNIEFNKRFGGILKRWLSNYLTSRSSGGSVNVFNGTLNIFVISLFFIVLNSSLL